MTSPTPFIVTGAACIATSDLAAAIAWTSTSRASLANAGDHSAWLGAVLLALGLILLIAQAVRRRQTG